MEDVGIGRAKRSRLEQRRREYKDVDVPAHFTCVRDDSIEIADSDYVCVTSQSNYVL